MRERVREALARALEVEPDAVRDDAALGYTPEWDSVAHMRFVLELEGEFGVRMTTDEILDLQSFDDAIAFVSRAGTA